MEKSSQNALEISRPNVPREFEVDDKFPVIYSYPDEKAYWVCDYDEQGKLTSVVLVNGEKQLVGYIETPEKFYEIRKDMEQAGWIRNTLPKVNVSFRQPQKPPRKVRRKAEREKAKEEKRKKKTASKDEKESKDE